MGTIVPGGINMWKGAKSDLSDLENGPLDQFKQTRLLEVHYPGSTLPGKLYAKIEKRLLNSFGANGLQVQNLTLPTLKNDL